MWNAKGNKNAVGTELPIDHNQINTKLTRIIVKLTAMKKQLATTRNFKTLELENIFMKISKIQRLKMI